MAVNIGPKIGIDGEAEYRSQLNNIIQQSKTLDAEMKALTSSFDKEASAQEKAAKTAGLLEQQIANQQDRIAKLSEMVAKSAEVFGENATETLKWKEALANAQNDLHGMTSRLDEIENGVDDVNDSMEEGEKGAASFADVLKANLLSDAIIGGVKALASAMAEVAKAAVNFGKDVVEHFADYEQLQGGIQKLFNETTLSMDEYAASVGKSVEEISSEWGMMTKNARFVMQNAEQAFKTSGLSINEYMETVTGFSASLIESLGGDTEAAVAVADRAIRDMSDNANTFGTDMQSIQNAYQGFAKGQYTMLDNLKLGYGGTKTEMERLIADAAKLTDVQSELGITVDANSLSFGNIVNAISVMQTEMSIAGTTAKEAEGTISGSLTMLEKSYENFITLLGSNTEDAAYYLDDVIDAFMKVVENIKPVVERMIQQLPDVLDRIIEAVKKFLPDLLAAAKQIINSLLETLLDSLPDFIDFAVELVFDIADTLIDNLDKIIDAAIKLILALTNGLIDALPKLLEKAPVIIVQLATAIIKNFPKIVETGMNLLGALIEGIISSLKGVFDAGAKIVENVWNGIKTLNPIQWGKDLISNFIQGIKDKFAALKESVRGVASTVKKMLGFSEPEEGPLSDFHTYAPDMMKLFAKGITDNAGLVTDAAERAFNLQPTIAAASTSGAGSSAVNYGGFNFVINAAEGQDVNQIADEVMERIQTVVGMREAVFA